MVENIFVFTNSYPYDFQYTEIAFLQNEVNILAETFNVYIVPSLCEGNKAKIPESISIINNFSKSLKESKKKGFVIKAFSLFRYKYSFYEFVKCRSFKQLYNLILNTHQILSVYNWARKNSNLFELSFKTIIYTYWCTNITLGLELYKEKINQNLKIISRAHGGDLYLDRKKYNPYYMLRIRQLDYLFLVSNAAKNYLLNIFPQYSNKYIVSYLGTRKERSAKQRKQNNNFLIVSCSTINTLKRVDVILQSITQVALKNSEKKIHWIHFGGGPLEADLKEQIKKQSISNLKIEITGIIENKKIHEFYANNRIDCFVHTSSSEGGIVLAIVEAQSYGIPVVATNVGGIPEVINGDNGILVNSEVDIEEISESITKIIFNPGYKKELSTNAVKNWEGKFKAEKNYSEFVNIIKNI